ncbi:O-antigen ligase family protein [Mesorhizobium xinjiangense]|uniref:O-antigen ligase family protein n=1 Tax=Mesorhizobium xinjiangense TaxID=2678685 RepID=UPI0018DE0112|nr:O-antigen ligase family protein [Mesorhizobium xinjiangense]
MNTRQAVKHLQVPFYRRPVVAYLVMAGIIALVSAVWLETDTYRYVDLALIGLGLWVYYLTSDRPFPSIGAMGWACCFWAAYVVFRYYWSDRVHPDNTGGSAEGIYLFPILYITTGYIFELYRDRAAQIAWIFMLVSLVMLAVSLDVPQILASAATSKQQIDFLFHYNPIHSSVGGGLILIAAFCFLMDLAGRYDIDRRVRYGGIALACLVMILALLGIVGARSKGVWIALVATLPFAILAVLAATRGRVRLWLIVAACAGAAIGAALFAKRIMLVIGPIISSAWQIVERVASGEPLSSVVLKAIESGHLPLTFDLRLQIWWNAFSIWQKDWLFGQSLYWENLWQQTRFGHVGYELMHNGYLEVAIRFGLLGLAFYTVLFGWAAYQVLCCVRRGLINRNLGLMFALSMVFFLVSMLSNSNIRLAVGESYMLVAGAFGFCCFYLRQLAAESDNRP